MTIRDYILDGKTDAEIVVAYNGEAEAWTTAPLSIVDLGERLNAMLGNVAQAEGALNAVLGSIAAQTSPVVQVVSSSLASGASVVFGPAVRGVLALSLPAEQWAAFSVVLRARPTITESDVATERAALTAQADKDTLSNWLASRVSVAQQAVNSGAATTETELKAILSA